jgi:hypothetical protein
VCLRAAWRLRARSGKKWGARAPSINGLDVFRSQPSILFLSTSGPPAVLARRSRGERIAADPRGEHSPAEPRGDAAGEPWRPESACGSCERRDACDLSGPRGDAEPPASCRARCASLTRDWCCSACCLRSDSSSAASAPACRCHWSCLRRNSNSAASACCSRMSLATLVLSTAPGNPEPRLLTGEQRVRLRDESARDAGTARLSAAGTRLG